MDKPRVAAVIQARMGSTRLPGKVLMPLAGKPLIWHIIHRLRKCTTVDDIAIATSTFHIDDPLESFAASEGICCIRGSEHNVLQRFDLAATRLNSDVIVRITGDAPLIDPETIDRLVHKLISEDADSCSGGPSQPNCIHEGFSAMSRRALTRMLHEAPDDPAAREHVTAYLKEHPERFKVVHIVIHPDHLFEGARISIDTPADLRFLSEIYRHLGVPAGEADITDVVRLLRAVPDLLTLNSHVNQKKVREKTRQILIRCDGDERIGLGHVVRSLAFADELRDIFGFGVTFALISGAAGLKMIRDAGFPCEVKEANIDEAAWLGNVITIISADVIVVDIRTDLSLNSLEHWRQHGALTVVVDDPSDRRLAADIAIYPPVPQLNTIDWAGFKGILLSGWEYIMLRREFYQHISVPVNVPPRILVSMGGSDPSGLIFSAIDALEKIGVPFHPVIVVGKGFTRRQALSERLIKSSCSFEVLYNVSNMAQLMAQSDLALASFGMTAYELAAIGVPTVLACLSEDHEMSADALVAAGAALCLGVEGSRDVDAIASLVGELLTSDTKRDSMRQHALRLGIGQGCNRAAGAIANAMEGRP